MVALEDSDLWLLHQERLHELRAQASPRYSLLLSTALRWQGRRFESLTTEARVPSGRLARPPSGKERQQPGLLSEDFIRQEVMPLYANTHTEASESGRQTSHFREEARSLVARSVGGEEDCAVIFVGSGATGAINKLIDILNLRLPADLSARYDLLSKIPADERPVVFHGPYEHHSNILPWRHSIADVVVIPLDEQGGIDLGRLTQELHHYKSRPLRIGSFSAASNVTGIATDVEAVATLLHQHGALSFWDYAAAGPYVPIHMKPGAAGPLSYKDAVFLWPHKFIGGPGSPGVLVVRKELVRNTVPTQPGGGTIDFVTRDVIRYSHSITHREEAGTPAIVESIRCGLVFHVKEQVGAETIHRQETAMVKNAIASFRTNPKIVILGNPDADRLSIVSFLIRHWGPTPRITFSSSSNRDGSP